MAPKTKKAGGGDERASVERTIEKKKKQSRSNRARLIFPVGRIHRLMKESLVHGRRVAGTGAIYVAAVMEYICAEILTLSGTAAAKHHRTRISPRHLMLAIRSDQELDQFIKATIASGGIVPHFDRAPKKS